MRELVRQGKLRTGIMMIRSCMKMKEMRMKKKKGTKMKQLSMMKRKTKRI